MNKAVHQTPRPSTTSQNPCNNPAEKGAVGRRKGPGPLPQLLCPWAPGVRKPDPGGQAGRVGLSDRRGQLPPPSGPEQGPQGGPGEVRWASRGLHTHSGLCTPHTVPRQGAVPPGCHVKGLCPENAARTRAPSPLQA